MSGLTDHERKMLGIPQPIQEENRQRREARQAAIVALVKYLQAGALRMGIRPGSKPTWEP